MWPAVQPRDVQRLSILIPSAFWPLTPRGCGGKCQPASRGCSKGRTRLIKPSPPAPYNTYMFPYRGTSWNHWAHSVNFSLPPQYGPTQTEVEIFGGIINRSAVEALVRLYTHVPLLEEESYHINGVFLQMKLNHSLDTVGGSARVRVRLSLDYWTGAAMASFFLSDHKYKVLINPELQQHCN